MLYQLPTDPRERRNLAKQQSQKIERLLKVFLAWKINHPTERTVGAPVAERIEARSDERR